MYSSAYNRIGPCAHLILLLLILAYALLYLRGDECHVSGV